MSTLEKSQYLLLGTFRKNGKRVDTPVWFAPEGDSFYVVSNNQAGKVKRLRNGSRCDIAPCTMLGKPVGEWQETQAWLLHTADEMRLAHQALKRKYGWQMRLLDTGAWLGGRIGERSFIRIDKPTDR